MKKRKTKKHFPYSFFDILSSKNLLVGFAICFFIYFFIGTNVIRVTQMEVCENCYLIVEENKIIIPQKIKADIAYLYAYIDRNQKICKLQVTDLEYIENKTKITIEQSAGSECFFLQDALFTVEVPSNSYSLLRIILGL